MPEIIQTLEFDSSGLAFVCFEISTLLKLEISSFRRVEISRRCIVEVDE